MQKPKSIKELLTKGGPRLRDLETQLLHRKTVLSSVCDALPPHLASAVVSAGIDKGRLTIGVADAAHAARLRYATDVLREHLCTSTGTEVKTVRIKVVPPRA